MKILVCGGTGFIGSALTRNLQTRGHEVTATMNSRDPDPKVEGVKYTEADLTVRGTWNTALGCAQPEVVYMCAGKTGGSGLDPLHFVTDNALMALNMFRSCAEFGVRKIIAMSSTTGYRDTGIPMAEEDYFNGEPHPAYFNPGHTRRFIERLAEMWAHKLETVFVRCAGGYGPGDDFDPTSSHVIAATVRKVAERQDPFKVWGNGENVREGVYIDDLVDALYRCLYAPAGAYNIGLGKGLSVNQIIALLCQSANFSPRIEYDFTKPQMLGTRLLDCAKAKKILGWEPTVSMAEGLRRTLFWYENRARK